MSGLPRRDGWGAGAWVASTVLVPVVAAILFFGAIAVVVTIAWGAVQSHLLPRLRRQRPVVRETQVPDAFAAIAESMPEFRAADRDLADLYLLPDHAHNRKDV